jgi:probable O-glycosylation ligase (exosortase A-associated)
MPIALPSYKYVNRNGFANSLAMIFPIAYILSRTTKNRILKLLGMFAAIWCVIGTILTYSRGGFLALGVGILALIFFERKKWRIIGVILILFILILPRLSEKYINRMNTIQTYQEDPSAMGRIAANHAAINMVKENPIFGVGAGNFNELVVDFTPLEYRQYVKSGLSIHNVILQAASETGLVGLTIFLLLILRGFWNSLVLIMKKKIKQSEELYNLSLMLGIALFAIFIGEQFGQGAYYKQMYLVLPLISATKMIIKNNLNQKK